MGVSRAVSRLSQFTFPFRIHEMNASRQHGAPKRSWAPVTLPLSSPACTFYRGDKHKSRRKRRTQRWIRTASQQQIGSSADRRVTVSRDRQLYSTKKRRMPLSSHLESGTGSGNADLVSPLGFRQRRLERRGGAAGGAARGPPVGTRWRWRRPGTPRWRPKAPI